MDAIPTSFLFIALVACLLASAFFSASETAMMAVNRYRLKARVAKNERAAILTQALLHKIEKLLGVILLGSSFVNSSAATLSTVIAFRVAGDEEWVLGVATALVTFSILIFSEAFPKVIAASRPEPVALASSYLLAALLKILSPIVYVVNIFVRGLLKIFRLGLESESSTKISPEELRLLVLEAGNFIEKKHHSILMNLFDLESITVNDVMTPRHQIEALDLAASADEIKRQLVTCHHTRLPVYEADSDNILGVVHVRMVPHLFQQEAIDIAMREVIRDPYFIPSGTPLFTQLQRFQETQQRLGLVVDEYGEMLGLVTLEDILEQMVGEFTTTSPNQVSLFKLQKDGSALIDGKAGLRELNRKLGCRFPVDGPKTLNGLILEFFEDIPEAGTCLQISEHRLEIVQTQGRSIKSVRLYP
ncbi:HlyC/CorC family transporter [Parachitinimonas caeni]|uniref:HlyC/CorC family transporter n=1 Tax=Parachitinimonas caeni TaxID=3031301 RepID=A0ABT7DVG6_9NEIS|nr:HlyC/CorC family transporter [Parachitinimonas caeni]MDK2124033.1 HlyC/CorC family transporter [Parachitinimonas caeni]